MKTYNPTNNQPTKPGQVVAIDQLVSPTPRLIAQISGYLTSKRYKYATVFVDLYSRYGYVYLQKTASANETCEGKKAFEAHALRSGLEYKTIMWIMVYLKLIFGYKHVQKMAKD